MKVVLIEDDPGIIEYISMAFGVGWPDSKIVACQRGEGGVELVGSENPDAVILDLGLPDISGFEALKRIREFSDVPILIVSVRDNEQDIVKGIELGADEYVVKPFGQLELMARVKALIRRHSPKLTAKITRGPLAFDPLSGELTIKQKKIRLTRTEGIIMTALMKNTAALVTHSELAESIWGDDYATSVDTLRVYIKRLRSKIEIDPDTPVFIVARPGRGYVLQLP
ncbi:response regulator transcription factor [Dehalogenimonas sp. 4OHTPN]|uniref:Response regulator transcription factor n=1 Tax=Dehalogenimonas sp. 4OHTPN TaxID=3166643 RepID=A0AAU8G956_9CHLR